MCGHTSSGTPSAAQRSMSARSSGSAIASGGNCSTCTAHRLRLCRRRQGHGSAAVYARRLLLGHQPAIGCEHGIELQGAEEGVIADIEADESPELDDFFVRVMPAKCLVESTIYLVRGLQTHFGFE